MTNTPHYGGKGGARDLVSRVGRVLREQAAKAEIVETGAYRKKRRADASSEAVLKHFDQTPRGLYWRSPDITKPDIHVCGHFHAVASTRDEQGQNWGVLLQWKDRDGRDHEWAM